MPDVSTVDGINFVKIDSKDRRIFKLRTGNAIKLWKQCDDSRYLLSCCTDFAKARPDACQVVFEQMQKKTCVMFMTTMMMRDVLAFP